MQRCFFSLILVVYSLLGREWSYCRCSEVGQAASRTHVHPPGKLCLPRDLAHFLHCPKHASQHPLLYQDHLLHWLLQLYFFFHWAQQCFFLSVSLNPKLGLWLVPSHLSPTTLPLQHDWEVLCDLDLCLLVEWISQLSSPHCPYLPISLTTSWVTQAHCSDWPASLLLLLSLSATPPTQWLSLGPSFPSWDLTLWYSELCLVFLPVLVKLKLSPHVGPT